MRLVNRKGYAIGTLLLALSILFIASSAALAESQVELSEDEIDFGNVVPNATRTDTFDIEYESDDRDRTNVEIEARIVSSCDDLRVTPTTTTLRSGVPVTITVTLQGRTTPGPILCSVTVITKNELFVRNPRGTGRSCSSIDSARPCVEVKANIVAPLLVLVEVEHDREEGIGSIDDQDPEESTDSSGNLEIDYGTFGLFETYETTIEIGNAGDANLIVDITATNRRDFGYTGLGNNITIPPGRTREIVVQVRPTGNSESFRSTLNIRHRNTQTSGFSEDIVIELMGDANTVIIDPSTEFLQFEGEEGEEETLTFTLRNRGIGNFTAIVDLFIEETDSDRSFVNDADFFTFDGDEETLEDLEIEAGRSSSAITIHYKPTEAGIDEAVIRGEVRVRNLGGTGRRDNSIVQTFFINLRGEADFATTAHVEAIKARQNERGLTLNLQGKGISGGEMEVFSLSGDKVFHMDLSQGNKLIWNMRRKDGAVLANGIYIYRVYVKDESGKVIHSEIKKLVILR